MPHDVIHSVRAFGQRLTIERASKPVTQAPAAGLFSLRIDRDARRVRIDWGRAIISACRHFVSEEGPVVAGYLAFTCVFAIFPFLIFLLSLAGFIGQMQAASESIQIGLDLMPPEVRDVLRPTINQIMSGTTPGLMTIGIAVAIWAASSGVEAARHALDKAYGSLAAQRNFILLRLQSIAITIVGAALVLIAVLVLVAAPFIRDALAWVDTRSSAYTDVTTFSRFALGISIMLGVTLAMHLILPAARLRLSDVWPGAVGSILIWAAAVGLYSLYLRNLARYNLTYGSLGGIVLTLFFFYLSGAIFILGAQLNGAVRRQRLRARGLMPGPSDGSLPDRRT